MGAEYERTCLQTFVLIPSPQINRPADQKQKIYCVWPKKHLVDAEH